MDKVALVTQISLDLGTLERRECNMPCSLWRKLCGSVKELNSKTNIKTKSLSSCSHRCIGTNQEGHMDLS